MRWPVQVLRVAGHSMAPTLTPGQLVLVRVGSRPRIGDIVVAIHGNRQVIKRVAECSARQVRLVGNGASTAHDIGWVPIQSVVGRAYYKS